MSLKSFSLALLLAAAMIMATGYSAEAEYDAYYPDYGGDDGDFGGSYDSYSPPDVGTMIDLQPDISTFDAGAAPNFGSQITPSLPDYSYGTISSSYYNPNLPSAITTTQEHILPEPAFNYGNEAIVGSMITNSPDSGPYFVTKPLSPEETNRIMTDFSPGEFKKTATEFSPAEFKEIATEFDTRNLGHNSIIQPIEMLKPVDTEILTKEIKEPKNMPILQIPQETFDLIFKDLPHDNTIQPIETKPIELDKMEMINPKAYYYATGRDLGKDLAIGEFDPKYLSDPKYRYYIENLQPGIYEPIVQPIETKPIEPKGGGAWIFTAPILKEEIHLDKKAK